MGKKYRAIGVKAVLTYILTSITLFGMTQESYKKPYNLVNRKPGLMRHYTLRTPTEKSAEKFDRFNTDFFYNDWIGSTNDVATKFYSIGHAINLMFDVPFSKTSRLGIAIGLGYTHYNIRHNGDFVFSPTGGPNVTKFSTLVPYQGENRWINRTVLNQVDIPFEIRLRSRKERPKIKFYPGFKVGYIFDTFEKWRINDLEYKTFNFPDISPLQYGATLRIGINNVFLFGSYNLSYIFDNNNSNTLNLFSAGISIGWF